MQDSKILILYISSHSGHYKAAISIQKAISQLDSRKEIMCLDAFKYTNPVLNKIVHKTYLHVIRKRPEVWGYLYDNPKVVLKTQKIKTLFHKYNSRKLISLISEFKPKIVICTQAFPCGMIADLKKYYNLDLPLIGVLTDYVAHSFWFYENVDLYVVPDESTKMRMVQNGILESRIKIYGIPIEPNFSLPVNKYQVLKELNFDFNKPIILVMGGGRGLGNIGEIIFSFYKLYLDFQVIVVCGVNKKLYNYLKRRQVRLSKTRRIKVFGYVDNVHELMSISDILISKPGGITTAEALAKGLPMIIFNPLPGQEKCNSEFLLNTGAAISCDRISDLPVLIKELLENRNKLKFMSQNALRYGHPDSSLKISSEVLRMLDKVYV